MKNIIMRIGYIFLTAAVLLACMVAFSACEEKKMMQEEKKMTQEELYGTWITANGANTLEFTKVSYNLEDAFRDGEFEDITFGGTVSWKVEELSGTLSGYWFVHKPLDDTVALILSEYDEISLGDDDKTITVLNWKNGKLLDNLQNEYIKKK